MTVHISEQLCFGVLMIAAFGEFVTSQAYGKVSGNSDQAPASAPQTLSSSLQQLSAGSDASAQIPFSSPPFAPAPSRTENVNGFSNEDQLAQNKPQAQGTRSRTTNFPLPSCYVNADGFMCCSKELETVMSDAYKKLAASRPDWKKCNIQQITVSVQKATQERFKVPFEVVAGAGDYASKNYFRKDLICKIKRDKSYILAFAAP